MSIEYLDNISVGDKLDLSKFKKEKPQFNIEQLYFHYYNLIKIQTEKYNKLANQEWLHEDGSVKMFEHSDLKNDLRLVEAQEDNYSIGLKRVDNNPAILCELVVTVLLQKLLPERFVVVRASKYDDYNNGVDNLILDQESGNVICGLDEVISRSDFHGVSKKELKLRNKMEKGGFQIKYGAKFKDAKLSLESLKNIPAFYLSMDKTDLVKLSSYIKDGGNNPVEQELFLKLKNSLLNQVQSYAQLSLAKELQNSIKDFQLFLESLN